MNYTLILFMILTACGYQNTILPTDAELANNDTNKPTSDTLDYATVKSKVFQNYCYRCHSSDGGNKGQVNLETYENVKELAQTINDEVSSGRMPKEAPFLPTKLKQFLLHWIESGAPETLSD